MLLKYMIRMTKDLVRAASLLTVGTGLVGAQPTSAPPAAVVAFTNQVGPRIQFETPVYDFGRVRSGEAVKYTFAFTNTGDRLLIINSVQPGCHCTTAGEWTRQVEPGKTGGIPIQFDTSGTSGMVVRNVTVGCNITNQPPLVSLQIRGTTYKPVDVNPPYAILTVPPDAETSSVVVTITNNTDEPLLLSEPQSNNRMFSGLLVTNQPGRGYQLKVSTVPPLGTGSIQGQVTMKTTWTNTPVISVTVVANVQPALMAMPPYLSVGPGPLANAVTNSVTIQNNSTNPVTLSEPAVNVPGVEATIRELQPGKSFAAMLAFPQGFLLSPGRQVEFTAKSSNPKFPLVKVPVIQLGRPAGPKFPPPQAGGPHMPVAAPAVTPTAALPAGTAPPVIPVQKLSPVGIKPPPPPPPLPPGY